MGVVGLLGFENEQSEMKCVCVFVCVYSCPMNWY